MINENYTEPSAEQPRIQEGVKKWAHLDSNQGPTGYEPAALSTELWALSSCVTSVSGWLSPTAARGDLESGWRESNPQQQLGRLRQYHFATPARLQPVGAAGLEPATSASQTQRASRLRHAPLDYSIPLLVVLVKQQRGEGCTKELSWIERWLVHHGFQKPIPQNSWPHVDASHANG